MCRAALASYCYRRGHLKGIGLAIASTCNVHDLETWGGTAGAALFARSREAAPPRRSLALRGATEDHAGQRLAAKKPAHRRRDRSGRRLRARTARIGVSLIAIGGSGGNGHGGNQGRCAFQHPGQRCRPEHEILYRNRGLQIFESRTPDKVITFLDAGGVCVLLIKRPAPIVKGPLDMSNGVHHAFMIDAAEYQAAVDGLRAKGVEVFFEEDRRGGTIDGPRAYFRDPDGTALEFINRTAYVVDK